MAHCRSDNFPIISLPTAGSISKGERTQVYKWNEDLILIKAPPFLIQSY